VAIFTIVFIVITVFLVIFLRRRFKRLKSELAHVHYIANSETGDQKHIYSLPLITLPDRTDDSDYNLEPDEDQQRFENPMYATFRNPSPTNSTQRLTSSQGQNLILKQTHLHPPPPPSSTLQPRVQDPVLHCNKNVYSAIDELKESTLEDNIYEELKKRISANAEQILDESYDRLDFSRPIHELKPHYQSTDTIKSQRSRNSSDPSKEDRGPILEESFESHPSEADFCQSVLTSFENLNTSATRTRKTIYKPEAAEETDSGISSNRSTTTVPLGPGTEHTEIM